MDEARKNMMGPEDWHKIRYFTEKEFTCPCGVCGRTWMNRDFVLKLDSLRKRLSFPVKINSGYRCEEYNKKIGGSPNSKHIKGLAVDIHIINGQHRYKLLKKVFEMNFSGIGFGDTFLHIDDREGNQTTWTY